MLKYIRFNCFANRLVYRLINSSQILIIIVDFSLQMFIYILQYICFSILVCALYRYISKLIMYSIIIVLIVYFYFFL